MSPSTQGTRRRVVADPVPALGPGLAAVRDGHWMLVTAPTDRRPGQDLGLPGPWRVTDVGRAVAELSLAWRRADDRTRSRGALMHWAVGTVDGVLPADAPVAPDTVVAEFAGESGLAIDVGSRALVARLEHDGPRLSLRVGMASVPELLPETRRAWLEQLLADSARRWRLVRCGVSQSTGTVVTEVDLSGAPLDLLPDLLQHGLAALRHVTAWLAPGVEACLDPTLHSDLLDGPPRAGPGGHTQSPTPFPGAPS